MTRILLAIVAGAVVLATNGTTPLAGQGTPGPLGELQWVRTGGPLGGLGYDIRMRPDNPDIMYVTDGQAGVHTSTDGGQTWLPVNQGIEERTGPTNDSIPVFCLTIDPNNHDIVWLGLQGPTGIYRSADGGQTWTKRIDGIAETEDGDLTIRHVAVEPGNSQVVYAAGEVSSVVWAGEPMWGKAFERVQGVIYKSNDAGLNWQAVWRGDNLARYVLIDPTDVNTLYASTGIFDREAANSDPATDSPGGVGIVKSTDGGRTWAPINVGLSNLYVGSLFMNPQDSQVLLAGAGNLSYPDGGGIYRTANGGSTWAYVEGQDIQSVEFASGKVAYAAGAGEFYRSEDGGRTWRAYDRWGPDGIRPGFPIDMQADPRDAMRIFINNYGGGNFMSADGGASWTSASAGYTGASVRDVAVHPRFPEAVYANGRSGPFKSEDGGQTWVGINPTEITSIEEGRRITIDPNSPSHILMSSATNGLTYESTDDGLTWALVIDYAQELQGLPDNNQKQQGVQAIAFAPSRPEKVYGGFGIDEYFSHEACATPPIASILTSTDGGHTWVRHQGTAIDGLTVTAIVVHQTNADIAWAATAGGGVFRTSDGGATWVSAASGLQSAVVESLVGDPTNSSVLYAGTAESGVFKTQDAGASWQASNVGMDPAESINAIVVDPLRPHVVYAGSSKSGVYVSADAAATWQLHNNGLQVRSVQTLGIASDGELLYTGTNGGGVFRLGELPLTGLR